MGRIHRILIGFASFTVGWSYELECEAPSYCRDYDALKYVMTEFVSMSRVWLRAI
jgi:hypothetical protein